jgi:hypothetical protein
MSVTASGEVSNSSAVARMSSPSGDRGNEKSAEASDRNRLADATGRVKAARLERLGVGEAILVARRAASVAPHDARAWAVLGDTETAANRPADARAAYLACIENTSYAAAAACRNRAP